jgi:hypothetical protein
MRIEDSSAAADDRTQRNLRTTPALSGRGLRRQLKCAQDEWSSEKICGSGYVYCGDAIEYVLQ